MHTKSTGVKHKALGARIAISSLRVAVLTFAASDSTGSITVSKLSALATVSGRLVLATDRNVPAIGDDLAGLSHELAAPKSKRFSSINEAMFDLAFIRILN